MTKISILIILLAHLCTALSIETSNNISLNQFLETKQLSNDNECGHTSLLLSDSILTSTSQWPWMVAIFIQRFVIEFHCAATLLTNRHILTAAHCVKISPFSNITEHPSQLTVALGRFNLNEWGKSGVINREVEKIVIHPDYTPFTADSDLAILTLKTPVEFSPSVKPICLWSGSTDFQDIVNRTGYVVGWGTDGRILSPDTDEPRMAKILIVSQETCLQSDRTFIEFKIISERTFCAGWRNNSGSRNENSGSGLVLFDNTTDRYQLRGVAWRSERDLRQYVVYVDVAKYIPWIQQQIFTT